MRERIASVYLMRLDPKTIAILSGRVLDFPRAVHGWHLGPQGLEYFVREVVDNEYVHKAVRRTVRGLINSAKKEAA